MLSKRLITEEHKAKYNLTEEILNNYFFEDTFQNALPVEYQSIEESIEEALANYNEKANGKLEAAKVEYENKYGTQAQQAQKLFSLR